MRRTPLVLTALLGCREPNPAFVADDGASTGGATVSTSDATVSGDSSDSLTGASAASTDASSADATETTAGQADTTDPDTTSTTSVASSSGESTGAPPSDPYPGCDLDAEPPCPREFPECISGGDYSWCTQLCDVDDDCPAPVTGDPEVVCAGPGGNECALDCADGQTCPDGMSCMEVVNNIERCVWPG